MADRFCPQCGTRAVAAARFCFACGAALAGGARVPGGGWRLTATGSAALGFLVVSGLAVWTAILTPDPPRPAPGGGGQRPQATAAAPSGVLPPDHPKVPMVLPEDVKTFIADLAAKAREKPEDLATWVRLGQVYYRSAQLDSSYYPRALAAFEHVLERDPKHPDALRGVANVHYEREEHARAIPAYERYLAVRPDDHAARTDLGTMLLYGGEKSRAIATYQDVIKRDPSFMQAHFNLAVAYAQQGDRGAALRELREARGLAPDDGVRRQLDDMIARIEGRTPPAGDSAAPPERSGFQAAVEQSFRAHPIMGPRIARFEWSGAGTGRVLLDDFPMDGMPPAVREKFITRLTDELRKAQGTNAVAGTIRMELADASSGALMATVTP
jgi:cytochrome c-type biogenesis protein CcmH/NrfG